MSAHLQKGDFRKTLLMQNAQVVKILRISESQLFKNSDTLEWQDDNQELKIQNRFHEVIGTTDRITVFGALINRCATIQLAT